MKVTVTNVTDVIAKVWASGVVESIPPGKSRPMEMTAVELERAKERTMIAVDVVEDAKPKKAKTEEVSP